MIICVCYGVTEEDIVDLLDSGIDTFDEISELLGASTGCGTCECQIRGMVDDYRHSQPSLSTTGNSAVTLSESSS